LADKEKKFFKIKICPKKYFTKSLVYLKAMLETLLAFPKKTELEKVITIVKSLKYNGKILELQL
jgi:hypothetical protein